MLPGAGADCSYTDSRTAHLSAPHCLAALQVWGLGQQLVQVTHGGVVEAPGWCFFWETSLCWSLDTSWALVHYLRSPSMLSLFEIRPVSPKFTTGGNSAAIIRSSDLDCGLS